jgi:molecular chaperone DnaK (HSP70)
MAAIIYVNIISEITCSSKDEIENMVKNAEKYAAEDQKRKVCIKEETSLDEIILNVIYKLFLT